MFAYEEPVDEKGSGQGEIKKGGVAVRGRDCLKDVEKKADMRLHDICTVVLFICWLVHLDMLKSG